MAPSNRLGECLSTLWGWRKKILLVVLVYLAVVLLYQYQYERLRALIPMSLASSSRLQNTQDSSALRMHIKHYISVGDAKLTNSTNTSMKVALDIHIEHPVLGHTGETVVGHAVSENETVADSHVTVAIGGGITSNKLTGVTKDNIPQKFQFFFTLLPSFCKSASKGYSYHFYLAYDHVDEVFKNEALATAFHSHFLKSTEKLCPKNKDTSYALHLVQCSHHKKPAWAQNDAMMEGYLDNMEYFYRVNDDTDLKTGDWTNVFIKALDKYKPTKVGVVGPKHRGGNMAILTYDFVHRTHVDIFGFYYPRFFTDWYADDWVTKVYKPDRSTKMPSIQVTHTMKLGQRYATDWSKSKGVGAQIDRDKQTLKRYLVYRGSYPDDPPPADSTKVISMSLYGNDPLYTMGAIRNAQILPVFFPGWSLRIYVAYAQEKNENLKVPVRIINKLQMLGAEIAYVDTSVITIPPRQWRYLVVDDNNVEVFLIRNAERRLRDRDAETVNLWLQNWQSFHCIRDHPKHATVSVVDGLWGSKVKPLQLLLGVSMLELLQAGTEKLTAALSHINVTSADLRSRISSRGDVNVLTDVIWTLVQEHALCHDSVSCKDWPGAHKFPLSRSDKLEYLGETFDIYQQSAADDKGVLKTPFKDCEGKEPVVATMPERTRLPEALQRQSLFPPSGTSGEVRSSSVQTNTPAHVVIKTTSRPRNTTSTTTTPLKTS